jgi:adenylate cyclase
VAEPIAQTFMFADLASYTALTEVHGDEEAVRLVEGYCAAMRRLLGEHGAHEVKTIGDALLVCVPEAAAGVRLGIRAAREVGGAGHGFPSVRVGMHHGPAIERAGDYFGRTVNIAARVSALAGAGEVLVTDAVVAAAGDLERVRFLERGRQSLRGIEEPVLIYVVSPGAQESPEGLPLDPVCHMAVDPERAAAMVVHEGVRYYLCTPQCARRFVNRPEDFVPR